MTYAEWAHEFSKANGRAPHTTDAFNLLMLSWKKCERLERKLQLAIDHIKFDANSDGGIVDSLKRYE